MDLPIGKRVQMSEKLKVFLKDEEKAKNGTYFSALFARSSWFPKLKNIPLTGQVAARVKPQVVVAKAPVETVPTKPVQEKEKANAVAKEKVKKADVIIGNSFSDFLAKLNDNWQADQISGLEGFNESIDVMFYGLDEFSKEDLPEFVPVSLLESEQDLLGKMISAMNLKKGEFARVPLIEGDNVLSSLAEFISYFKPKVVVTLGAKATNTVLEKKVKLSAVHGDMTKKSFPIQGGEIVVDICPLFHPQFLEINPSMKRTAWIDMKKVMDLL